MVEFSQNGQIVSNADVVLISHLKDELDKTNEKMVYLEKELTLAKSIIYENEEFAVAAPQQIEMLEKDKKKRSATTKNTELESAKSLAVQEKLEQLKTIEMQRKKLSVLEEKLIKETKAHDAQIETYQQLIKQKEDERGALIAELCTASRLEAPLHDSINEIENPYVNRNHELLEEVRKLNHEKQAILGKITCLENELQSMKNQLSLKTDEIEKEILLKNSMHDDLVKARTMLLEKEAQLFDLNNELKVAEVKIMKLETELANSADRLQVEQFTGNTLKMTVEELEDLYKKKVPNLLHLLKNVNDAVTLQGRELKETREKLAILRKKIRELELETMNSADKSLHETSAQQESSKSTTPAATVTKSPTSTTTSSHS
ncbi:hypothetical protein DINM_002032 [Dirofilaria immitis]|nr:hypothetical protein [Dirofilaria immitis]